MTCFIVRTSIAASTTDGDMSVVPIDGGSPTTFASGSGPIGKTSIALDLTSVYWAHSNGDAVFAFSKDMTVYP